MDNSLQKMLRRAPEETEYYREIFKGNSRNNLQLKDFPVVSKQTIRSDYNKFVAEFSDQETLCFSTSGTTGVPLKVIKTKYDYYTQLKNMWKVRMKSYGIKTTTRRLNLYFYDPMQDNLMFLDNRCSYNINATLINKAWLLENSKDIFDFQPEYVLGFSSAVLRFISCYEAAAIPFPTSVKHIECVGEPLLQAQAAYISRISGAEIIKNYSCTEVLGVALSCKCGNLHVIPENAMVEVVKNNEICQYGEEGDILLTSIHSRAMPFIRYRVGDSGSLWEGGKCACGNPNDIIVISSHRPSDFIELIDGSIIHSTVIGYIIENISYRLGNIIIQYQIRQVSREEIQINVCFSTENSVLLSATKMMFEWYIKQQPNALHKENWVIRSYTLAEVKSAGKMPPFVRCI